MIWYVLALVLIIAAIVWLATRDSRQTIRAGALTLIIGVVVVLVITYSGIWGG